MSSPNVSDQGRGQTRGLALGAGQQPSALEVYRSNVPSVTLPTAGYLVNEGFGTGTNSADATIDNSTGYGEIPAFGRAGAWPAAGGLSAPSGKGFLYDNTDLEGMVLLPGTWTSNVRIAISAGGSAVTADIISRFYVRHNDGTYTAIGNLSSLAQTLNPDPGWTTYGLTGTLPAISLAPDDKLYHDVWLNITSNANAAGIKARMGDLAYAQVPQGSGGAKSITQGFVPLLVDAPGGAGGEILAVAGRNLFTRNQSDVETDTSGFFLGGGVTATRDTSTFQFGTASLKVVTDGSGTFQQVEARLPAWLFTPAGQFTFSVWMKCLAGTPTIRFYCQGQFSNLGSVQNITLSTVWTRYTVTLTMPNPIPGEFAALRWDTGGANQAITVWMDGLQAEPGPVVTTWTAGTVDKYPLTDQGDAGTGAEGGVFPIPVADAATLAEVVGRIPAATDSATGTDAPTSTQVVVPPFSNAGAGADVASVPVRPALADAALGTDTDFVRTQGTAFMYRGKPLTFVGFNSYDLAVGYGMTPALQLARLQTLASYGVQVVRAWAFNDKVSGTQTDPNDHVLQYGATGGVWWEPGWVALDNAIAAAAQTGIKLLLTLSNNWADYGGKAAYAAWYNAAHGGSLVADNFHDTQGVIDLFKAYIYHALNRVNTVTGVAYKDDPTIMAWECINEGRYTIEVDTNVNTLQSARIVTMTAWYDQVSRYLKQLDPRHLVGSGGIGQAYDFVASDPVHNGSFYGLDLLSQSQLPAIDWLDYHLYPANDFVSSGADCTLRWPSSAAYHAQLQQMWTWAQTAGKPLSMGEFGIDKRNTVTTLETFYPRHSYMQSIWNEWIGYGASGVLLWDFGPNDLNFGIVNGVTQTDPSVPPLNTTDSTLLANVTSKNAALAQATSATLSVPVQTTITEAGVGAQTFAEGKVFPVADPAAGTDAGSPTLPGTALATPVDPATGTQTFSTSPQPIFPPGEVGTSADALSVPGQAPTLPTAGTGADALAALGGLAPAVPDAAIGGQAVSATMGLGAISDPAAGAEAPTLGTIAVPPLADPATGAQAASLGTIIPALAPDAATGADVPNLPYAPTFNEAGAGTDAPTIAAQPAIPADPARGWDMPADMGHATDVPSIPINPSLAEAATGADAPGITVVPALAPGTDAAAGAQQLGVGAALPLPDAATGAQVAAQAPAQVPIAEGATGADQPTLAGLAVTPPTDAAVGTDAALLAFYWPGPSIAASRDTGGGAIISGGVVVVAVVFE